MNVALFDYGAGNLHSLGKALERAGASVQVTADWNEALARDALVLPGVGAFGPAAATLPADRERVRQALEDGLPCLGVCLGMQLLFETSQEAEGRGIGFLAGSVCRLDTPVAPQMGWNGVAPEADPVWEGTAPLVAYFANSFVCAPTDPNDVIAWSEYQGVRFPAAVRKGLTWGMQFHPEKSSGPGQRLISNWVTLAEECR